MAQSIFSSSKYQHVNMNTPVFKTSMPMGAQMGAKAFAILANKDIPFQFYFF